MSRQPSLWDTPNAIFLPELGDGAGPCALPVGRMAGPCGQAHALANLSARQAGERGLLTSGTYGRTGFTSSGSVDLQSFLANRLRQNLPYPGLTLFSMTWKQRDTPAGRLICALRASGRSISGSGCGSWRSPNVVDSKGGTRKGSGQVQVCHQVMLLAPWQTPTCQDATGGPRTPDKKRGSAPGNQAIARLTHWPTPRSSEAGPDYAIQDREKSGGMSLQTTAAMSGWPTPATRDYRHANAKPWAERGGGKKGEQLNNVAVHSGPQPNGSPAGTGSSGQLNPAFVLWLMGYPPEWESCAPPAMPSSRKSGRSSSVPT